MLLLLVEELFICRKEETLTAKWANMIIRNMR